MRTEMKWPKLILYCFTLLLASALVDAQAPKSLLNTIRLQFTSTAEIVSVTSDPTATLSKPPGSLALRTNGKAYGKTASGTAGWYPIPTLAGANSVLLCGGASGVGAAYSECTLGTGLTMSGTTLNASAAAGLVLLAERSATGAASIDFLTRNATGQSGNMFQSDYDDYRITVDTIVPSGAAILMLRMSTNGSTFDSATNYSYAFNYGYPATNVGTQGSNSIAGIQWREINTTLATNGSANGWFECNNPLSSIFKSCDGVVTVDDNSLGVLRNAISGLYRSTSAVVGFQVAASTGTVNSGTVRVYGYAK